MQNMVLKLKKKIIRRHRLASVMIPWHVFPIIDIGGLRQKNRRETNLLGGIHKVDNVVGVLEMKPTAAPA